MQKTRFALAGEANHRRICAIKSGIHVCKLPPGHQGSHKCGIATTIDAQGPHCVRIF